MCNEKDNKSVEYWFNYVTLYFDPTQDMGLEF